MVAFTAVFIEHLARRGLSGDHSVLSKRAITTDGGDQVKLPFWAIVTLGLTFIGFTIIASLVEYTLRFVVGTLAMVESPAAAVTVTPITAAGEQGAPLGKDQEERLLETGTPSITVVHTKPITSKIRTTIRHLHTTAGFWSRWRGFKAFMLYGLMCSFVYGFLQAVISRVSPVSQVSQLLASVGSAVLLAPFHAAWTHTMISMPSQKSWRARIAPASAWKLLALPAAVDACLPHTILLLTPGLVQLFGVKDDAIYNDRLNLIIKVASFFVVVLCLILFVTLPAKVTLIRVEASFLPDDDETIVPFDRTFDGKVVPRILGGTGAIGFLDAWRSFTWEARRRVIKIYIKTAMVLTTMFVVFGLVLFSAFVVIAGHKRLEPLEILH